ncbi:MAG TPA: hypothetical protein VEA16_08925, partial [Vicinamibacterales bacterium]|nr:hypothetical protein [Vicinamibacterales bacterium]
AVDIIRRDAHLEPHVARAAALKLACTAVCCMILAHGFVVPEANQQFRRLTISASLAAQGLTPIATAGMEPRPGMRELTTLELLTHSNRLSRDEQYYRAYEIHKELNNRAGLALMPAIFVWLRWMSHDVRRRRRFWPLPIAAMMIVCMVGFEASFGLALLAESKFNLAPGTAVWLPIVVATVVGITLQRRADRRIREGSIEESFD